jgi:hypothetical protein
MAGASPAMTYLTEKPKRICDPARRPEPHIRLQQSETLRPGASRPSINIARFELRTKFAMNHGDDARVRELTNLRLALATFVLHLDAFEMRTHEGLLKVNKPGQPAPQTDGSNGPQKSKIIGGQQNWSTRFPGNKWDT